MNTSKSNSRRPLLLALLAIAPVALVGCSSTSKPTHAGDIDSIRYDPSPAMQTLDMRETDRFNMYTHTRDTNFRMLSKDIDRMFYLDRPSRLYEGIKP